MLTRKDIEMLKSNSMHRFVILPSILYDIIIVLIDNYILSQQRDRGCSAVEMLNLMTLK
jgi:hypothetical protein